MSKKIIFFDIDGTLFCSEYERIQDIVVKAIQETRKQGHLCFIASGRPYAYIAENVKEIGFDGYVLANGSNIKYQDKDLEVRYLDPNNVKELIRKLEDRNIEYVLQTNTLCYMNQDNECLLNFYKNCNINFHNICFEYNLSDIIERIVKIEAWVKDKEELEYAKSCFGAFAYELHPDNHSMEIYAKDVSKATGILDVLKLLNIDLADSYCFGDGPNDVEMFETVAHPIAMGNALDIIKERAEDICLTVQENGVAYKLAELFDIEL